MAHIYIALVDTPGFFASLIRHYLGQKYVHVVLSLDEQLSEAYSFGRRNPYIPLIAGFEREWSRQIAGAFPTAEYRICELDCTGEQKEAIRERLHKDYKNRFHMHYALCGCWTVGPALPPEILPEKPVYMFILSGRSIRGTGDFHIGETFFTGHPEGCL